MAPSSPELNAILTQRIEVAPGLVIMRVAPDGWELPEFVSGQFTVLGLPGTAPRCPLAEPEAEPPARPERLIRRAYSIASSSLQRQYLELYVALVSTGALTPRLLALGIGERLWMSSKISGMLTLDEVPENRHLVLVATGTGIAPYMSMIRSFLDSGVHRRFAVIHGAYHSWDLGYRDELLLLERLYPGFTYIPTLSHPHQEPVPWPGHSGFVQSVWSDGTLAREWGFQPTPADTHLFLCGNPLMIDGMIELLAPEGYVPHSKKEPGTIHFERFW